MSQVFLFVACLVPQGQQSNLISLRPESLKGLDSYSFSSLILATTSSHGCLFHLN
jgi:hypothetical protein